MSYIKDFEAEFVKKLHITKARQPTSDGISEKVLESYRNGITAG